MLEPLKGSILVDFHEKEIKSLHQMEMASLKEEVLIVEFAKRELGDMLSEGAPDYGEAWIIKTISSMININVMVNLLLSVELKASNDLNLSRWEAVLNEALFAKVGRSARTTNFLSGRPIIEGVMDCEKVGQYLHTWIKNSGDDWVGRNEQKLFKESRLFKDAISSKFKRVRTNNGEELEYQELKNPEIFSMCLKVVSEVVGKKLPENLKVNHWFFLYP